MIHENFFETSYKILQDIKSQCRWNKFTINDKELCRTGSFEGDQLGEITPWLRCPSIENCTVFPWSPVVKSLKETIESKFNCKLNIAKIQHYENGQSIINSHSDKIVDLDPATPIFIARFGAARACELVNKLTQERQEIEVAHNSLFVMTYAENLLWKHGILPSDTENESISIVFRQSITYRHPSGYVFGPNTPFKTVDDLTSFLSKIKQVHIWDRATQKKNMIRCFNVENKTLASIDIYKEVIEYAGYPW